MSNLEKLKILVGESGDTNNTLLNLLLEQAKEIILAHRFPSGKYPTRIVTVTNDGATEEIEETYVEPRYEGLQVRIAQALYNKMGAEGQTSHSENGIVRGYDTDGVPLALLREIVPVARVIS